MVLTQFNRKMENKTAPKQTYTYMRTWYMSEDHRERNEIGTSPQFLGKITFQDVIDLNVKCKTLKIF